MNALVIKLMMQTVGKLQAPFISYVVMLPVLQNKARRYICSKWQRLYDNIYIRELLQTMDIQIYFITTAMIFTFRCKF